MKIHVSYTADYSQLTIVMRESRGRKSIFTRSLPTVIKFKHMNLSVGGIFARYGQIHNFCLNNCLN